MVMRESFLTESFLLVVSIVMFWAFFRKVLFRSPKHLIVLLLFIPLLYFSISELTCVVTCDETYVQYESLDIANAPLEQWNMGALRTTDLLIGLPVKLVSLTTGFTKDILFSIAKMLHWLISFVLLLFCIRVFLRLIKQEKSKSAVCLSLGSVLLLPVVTLALKVYNYDSFSMLFTVLGILLFLQGFSSDRAYSMAGIVCLALAAQEKLIASPLLLTLIVLTGVQAAMRGASPKNPLKSAFFMSIIAFLCASAVLLFTFFTIAFIRGGDMPSFHPAQILNSVISWTWVFLRYSNSQLGSGSWKDLFLLPFWVIGLAFLAGSVSVCLARIVLFLKEKHVRPLLWIRNNPQIMSAVLLISVTVLGVVSAFFLKAYLYPHFPVSPGRYVPTMLFNNTAVHFNAPDSKWHTLFSIGWAYSVFVTAIPSAWLAAALIFAIRNFSSKKRFTSTQKKLSYIKIVVLLVPGLYGLTMIPVGSRYFNLFLLLFILITISELLYYISSWSPFRRAVLVGFLLTGTFLEALPFYPVSASFRPWWLSYPDDYMRKPSKGELNPWGMGWGEGVSIIGKRLIGNYSGGEDETKVRLYTNYKGDWLRRKPNIPIIEITDTTSLFSYGEHDYYLLNRMGITQSQSPFPDTVEPVMTLEFRGFVQAWVFRGSDIPNLFDKGE
ncbi:MAG: hypothetical protein ACOCW1_03325 [Chitinispirillaceae bacterium]